MSDMDGFESYEDLESLDDAGDGDEDVKKEGVKSKDSKSEDIKPEDKKAEDKKPEDKKSEDKKPQGDESPNGGAPKKTKGEIISIALKVGAVLITVAYFFLLIFGKKLFGADNLFIHSLNPFTDDGEVAPIRIVRIFSLIIVVLVVREFLTWIFDKILETPELTKKTGAAVIGLFQSAVRYTAVLVLFFMILSTVGLNSTEILAGVGILGMIIGLGAESIVADIVAGFFIIIERLYDVGDIITVDNFYGKVIAIGIRSTKIEDKSQNIKIIRNSAIGTLINMTEKKTMLALHLVLDYDVDIIKMEKVIKDALPAMKEKIPDISEGPNYLGITNIDGNGIQIRIIAGCTEQARPRVKRKLLREFKLLFDENNIPWGWNNYLKQTD